jgi:hypothetical protein
MAYKSLIFMKKTAQHLKYNSSLFKQVVCLGEESYILSPFEDLDCYIINTGFIGEK